MRILFVRLSALGDILHALWVLPALRAQAPAAQICLLCDERFAPLFAGLFDEIFTVRKACWRRDVARLARFERFDAAIDFQGRFKSAYCARKLAAKAYGYAPSGCKNPLAALFYHAHTHCDYAANVFERSRALYADFALSFLQIPHVGGLKIDGIFGTYTPPSEQVVLVFNGASKLKKAPTMEQLHALCTALAKRGARIWLPYASAAEYERAQQLCAAVCKRFPGRASMLARGDLRALKTTANACSAAVGADSGPLYLCALAGLRTLCLLRNRRGKPAARFAIPSPRCAQMLYDDFCAKKAASWLLER